MAVRASSSPPPPVTVPRLVTDPIWSLQIWPVTFTLAGQDFTIPAIPASGWLEELMVENVNLIEVLEELLPWSELEELRDLMWEDAFTLPDLHDLLLEVISAVTGRPWWISMKLITAARLHWDFLGAELALRGVRADTISIAAWLDVALLTIIRNIDPEKATMFTSQLEMPPPGVTIEPEAMEISAEHFMSMA